MNEMFKKVENILSKAGIEEYKAEAKYIILNVSNQTLGELYLNNHIAYAHEKEIIEVAKKRASTKAPIQHILGYSIFMNDKYFVDKNVLIPRDETEILVQKSIDLIKRKNNLNILEIGIGSGCISTQIAKYLKNQKKNFEILGVDISTSALQVALKNILNLGLEKSVLVRKSDIYSKIRPSEKFDLIVSNPPYIPYEKKDELDDIVKNYDPDIALFAKNEGLEFYEKIIADAPKYLKKGGFIAFELGYGQAQKVSKLLQEDFKNIKITSDLAGVERVITAKTI